jgi:nucleoside-diphosphate-sugar epimerase
LLGEQLEVFGDGKQLRDPVYVDDAVDAFLRAGLERNPASRTYNVGGAEAHTLLKVAQIMSEAVGAPPPVLRPFPPDRKSIDIGSYRTDSSRIKRELKWVPSVLFQEGIRRTLEFYKPVMPQYIDPGQKDVPCSMPEHAGGVRRLSYMEVR